MTWFAPGVGRARMQSPQFSRRVSREAAHPGDLCSMDIGSEAHKELFVRAFLDAHHRYQPKDLPWPDLGAEELALLRGLPFWTHALEFESAAGPMIRSVAEGVEDKRIREALELQAYEESRHADLVGFMLELYDLPYEERPLEFVANPLKEFIHFGFEECLDSFGAFGLFALARESELLPDPIFEIFENVMREEANHIVFFINWFAHHQAQKGAGLGWLRHPRALWHYGYAVTQLAGLVRDDDSEEGADFIATGAQAFVDDLTPRLVIETCLRENERRLAHFDRRLLVPRFVPSMARVALTGLRLWSRGRGAAVASGAGTSPTSAA